VVIAAVILNLLDVPHWVYETGSVRSARCETLSLNALNKILARQLPYLPVQLELKEGSENL
jgi:hypothetical protein